MFSNRVGILSGLKVLNVPKGSFALHAVKLLEKKCCVPDFYNAQGRDSLSDKHNCQDLVIRHPDANHDYNRFWVILTENDSMLFGFCPQRRSLTIYCLETYLAVSARLLVLLLALLHIWYGQLPSQYLLTWWKKCYICRNCRN